jgi:hypothetical protein
MLWRDFGRSEPWQERMELIDNLPTPTGLCVLTAQGELAFYAADRTRHVDALLSAQLRELLHEFLRAYLKEPDADDRRVAMICEPPEPRPWGRVSLFLAEPEVRRIYPVSSHATEALTAFQRKNREKSIYRGMELLLEYRSQGAEDTFYYCPVLFDRRTTLGQYGSRLLGFEANDATRDNPVLEVLNLAAGLSLSQRQEPAIAMLGERLHRGLIRKEGRQKADLTLLDDLDGQWGGGADGEDAYSDIDGRHERGVSLSADDLVKLHVTQRYERIERWLEMPYRPVDPGRLRGFVHFRDMDPARLALLSTHSLVYTAPAGVCLLERGVTDRWNLYLLEGSVKLEPEEGAILTVEGGSEKGAAPISFLKPRKYTVTAVSKVSFLWIHDVLLHVAQTSGRLAPAAPG